MENIYLDNAATTPVDSRVLDAMIPFYRAGFGNASSAHSFGRKAKVLLEDARDTIADFIGVRSSEIFFTSGGTEANNFALKGVAFNKLNKPTGSAQGHIISSKIEHSAVLDTLEYLRSRFGFKITYINNDKYGIIDLNHLKDSINEETLLMTVMHANNEIGVINDIAAIAEIADEKGILLHTDSVQSLGKTQLNINRLNCSLASISAHKIYGPKGIGALFVKKGIQTDKLVHGGSQERDRRGGTENIAAIAGFKKAVEILKEELDNDISLYKKLRFKLINSLKELYGEKIIINSPHEQDDLPVGRTSALSLHNIVNISFVPSKLKINPDTLLIKLDMKGIAVSTGSACTSGSVKPSHVLTALGYDDETAASTLRISFGRFNKESDVDYFLESLKEITGLK